MKKKILSLIVSVAMVMTVFAGMTVTASADDAATTEKAAFTVYTADVDADGKIVIGDTIKAYTEAGFEALAETGSIGGFYNKSGWTAMTSTKYVTMETLLADAGLSKEFVKALYGTEKNDEGNPSAYSKCDYKAYLDAPAYIYGETKGSDTAVTGAATEQPLAISVTSAKGTVAEDQTFADYMKATADTDAGHIIIAGSLNETDVAGNRIMRGASGIAVVLDKDAMTAAAKKLTVKNLTVKGSKAKATVKYKKTAGADGYKVVYSKTKNFKKSTTKPTTKTTYTLKLKKGTYYVKAAAYKKVDGKKVYGKYTAAKKVVVK